MALETLIYSALHDNAALHAIIGDNIYPKMLPQGLAYPAVAYYKVSGGQDTCLQGFGGFQNPRFAVDAFADTYAGVAVLTAAVIEAMTSATAFDAVIISDNDLSEEDPDTHHRVVDFSVWYNPNT